MNTVVSSLVSITNFSNGSDEINGEIFMPIIENSFPLSPKII